MSEQWELFDRMRKKTGRFHERGSKMPVPEGFYHVVVEIWVKTLEGKILLTKRHPNKSNGLMWECTGGAVIAGEDSKQGALRELGEETGIRAVPEHLVFLGERVCRDAFIDTYFYVIDEKETKLALQIEEVVDANYVSFEELEQRKNVIVQSVWESYIHYHLQLHYFTAELAFEEARIEDAPLLVSLYNAAFYEDYITFGECPAYGRTIEQMEVSIAAYRKQIIRYNQIPVGVISANEKDKGEFYIGCLCIIPEYQGLGLGTKALNYLRELHKGWKKLTLITPVDKEQNIRFYTEKNDFHIDGITMDGTVKVAHLVMEQS
ncbi:MAG: GNAT family N-acetyltransferase [bacterium]|nr:GNAT family N-acetyltransferase [bacterium]